MIFITGCQLRHCGMFVSKPRPESRDQRRGPEIPLRQPCKVTVCSSRVAREFPGALLFLVFKGAKMTAAQQRAGALVVAL